MLNYVQPLWPEGRKIQGGNETDKSVTRSNTSKMQDMSNIRGSGVSEILKSE